MPAAQGFDAARCKPRQGLGEHRKDAGIETAQRRSRQLGELRRCPRAAQPLPLVEDVHDAPFAHADGAAIGPGLQAKRGEGGQCAHQVLRLRATPITFALAARAAIEPKHRVAKAMRPAKPGKSVERLALGTVQAERHLTLRDELVSMNDRRDG